MVGRDGGVRSEDLFQTDEEFLFRVTEGGDVAIDPRCGNFGVGREPLCNEQVRLFDPDRPSVFHFIRVSDEDRVRAEEITSGDVCGTGQAQTEARLGAARYGQTVSVVFVKGVFHATPAGEKRDREGVGAAESAAHANVATYQMSIEPVGAMVVDGLPIQGTENGLARAASRLEADPRTEAGLVSARGDVTPGSLKGKRHRGLRERILRSEFHAIGHVAQGFGLGVVAEGEWANERHEWGGSARIGVNVETGASGDVENNANLAFRAALDVEGQDGFTETKGNLIGFEIPIIADLRHREAQVPFEPAAGVDPPDKEEHVFPNPGRQIGRQNEFELATCLSPLLVEKIRTGQFETHAHEIRVAREDRAKCSDRGVQLTGFESCHTDRKKRFGSPCVFDGAWRGERYGRTGRKDQRGCDHFSVSHVGPKNEKGGAKRRPTQKIG